MMNADRLDYYVNRFRGIELKRETIKEILYDLVLEAESPQENVVVTDNSAVIAKLQADKARLLSTLELWVYGESPCASEYVRKVSTEILAEMKGEQ